MEKSDSKYTKEWLPTGKDAYLVLIIHLSYYDDVSLFSNVTTWRSSSMDIVKGLIFTYKLSV